jgi:hypothetical protein
MFRSTTLFLSILLFVIVHSVSAQVEGESVFHFKAPNPNLKDFYLPSHKGLPRIGHQDDYGVNNFNLAKSMGTKEKQQLKERLQNIQNNTTLFVWLSLVRIMDETFSKMDREKFTRELKFYSTSENARDYIQERVEKQKFYQSQTFQDNFASRSAQRLLLLLAQKTISNNSRSKYFCPRNKDCTYERDSYMWGGPGANEFDRIDGYRSFVEDNFDDIRDWASALPEELYKVEALPMTAPYDFHDKAFKLRIRPGTRPGYSSNLVYQAVEPFEHSFDENSEYLHYNLSLPAEKARALKERASSTLYMAYRIKIGGIYLDEYLRSKVVSSHYLGNLDVSYHLSSPIIELYEDKALTRKVADINLAKI